MKHLLEQLNRTDLKGVFNISISEHEVRMLCYSNDTPNLKGFEKIKNLYTEEPLVKEYKKEDIYLTVFPNEKV